jgi:hypothetical protein
VYQCFGRLSILEIETTTNWSWAKAVGLPPSVVVLHLFARLHSWWNLGTWSRVSGSKFYAFRVSPYTGLAYLVNDDKTLSYNSVRYEKSDIGMDSM